jgi:hypothetical protein
VRPASRKRGVSSSKRGYAGEIMAGGCPLLSRASTPPARRAPRTAGTSAPSHGNGRGAPSERARLRPSGTCRRSVAFHLSPTARGSSAATLDGLLGGDRVLRRRPTVHLRLGEAVPSQQGCTSDAPEAAAPSNFECASASTPPLTLRELLKRWFVVDAKHVGTRRSAAS